MADDVQQFTMKTEIFPSAVRVTFTMGDNSVTIDMDAKDAKDFGFSLMEAGYRSVEKNG